MKVHSAPLTDRPSLTFFLRFRLGLCPDRPTRRAQRGEKKNGVGMPRLTDPLQPARAGGPPQGVPTDTMRPVTPFHPISIPLKNGLI